MATLKVIGSGSSGNCYVIECERQSLVLDLGLPWGEILAGVNYDIGNIVGCLVTHAHKDHSLSIRNALKYQLPVYTTPSAAESIGGVALNSRVTYKIGDFKVTPAKVPHGDAECYSYVIAHEEIGSLLFCTDLTDFPYVVPVNHILIEANYSAETLADNFCDNAIGRSHPENHLSIDACCGILERLKWPELQTVALIHLSRTNSDEKDFCDKVKDVIGWQPLVAKKGMQIDINREEF